MSTPSDPVPLLTIREVARLLNCSTRTVYRLNDASQLPRPLRVGSLLRWNRDAIDRWLAEGCPRVGEGRR